MTNNKKKFTAKKLALILTSLAILVGFSALIVNNYQTKTSFKDVNNKNPEAIKNQPQDIVSAEVNKEAQKITDDYKNIIQAADKLAILKPNKNDIIYGNKDAPIVMIEYASLSCPHCATFHREAFERLKTEYINDGKLQFIHRDFPLNQPALLGAMIAVCDSENSGADKSKKYYSFLRALFKTQDAWAFDEKFSEKLESIAKLDGMSSQKFNSCANNIDLQKQILTTRMQAARILTLQSTPSFFINDEFLNGYVDYQTIKNIIDKKLFAINSSNK
jgi:protein-disulfide isomerase